MAIGAAAQPSLSVLPELHRSTHGIGASERMMSDYSTIPSHGNYFTNLLNQEAVDVFDSEDNVDVQNVLSASLTVSSQQKQKGQSKNFSEEQGRLLVSTYLNISKDPITGRDKKDGTFWKRVENYFHVNKEFESGRNWSSLRHQWGIIQREVSFFQSYYGAIERKNESGKTINDKIAEAQAMFHKMQKKAFSVFHAWIILRHEPKWSSLKESNMATINLDNQNANEDGQLNVQRPPGRKAEKEIVRARKRDDNESDPFIEELKKMREARQETEKDRKARDDRFFELEKNKLDMERDQFDKKDNGNQHKYNG